MAAVSPPPPGFLPLTPLETKLAEIESSFAAAADEAPIPGTTCGAYGERLVVQVVDELARRTPDRVWATVTKSPYDIEHGFRNITVRELANAVNHVAWQMNAMFGKSESFDVIAYMGVSDVRYAIYMFAAIKTGHQMMIPSVRNSVSQHLSVLDVANCTKIFCTPEMDARVAELKEARPGLRAFAVPSLDDLLDSRPESYPYTKSWAEARTDPILIAHSSGSTGNPKPTTITNGVYSSYDNHRSLPEIPGRRTQNYTLLEFEGGGRFFNPFPPFHLAGLFAMTIMPVFYTCTVTMGPPEKPPSGEVLSQAMHKLPIRAAWCPPTVIEQIVALPGGFEQVAALDWIMYTGGPLAPSVGDRICRVTSVCQMYGSTETGPHTALVPLPENWNWFEWHPLLENEMDPVGDGTFEMVVHKDPELDWIRHLAQAYPDLEVWRTNDLFVQKPDNPKLWQFVGRRDDVIVLSNGEKFNPVNMEGVVTGHPLVKGAIVTGTARFQAALIVEPVDGLDMPAEKLIDEIWPTVEKANSVGPAHGRIFRHKVAVASPDKPFKRAGKGTIIRGQTTQLYAAEVAKLYDAAHEESAIATKLEAPESFEAVVDFVKTCVSKVLPLPTLGEGDDLFVLGMDSLQTLELLKTLKRSLGASSLNHDRLSATTIYSNPTIGQLSSVLHAALNNTATDAESTADTTDRLQTMKSLVEKYTTELPLPAADPAPRTAPGQRCVALTGSTGSLGIHLLERLLADPAVSKIYCLNRSDDALPRTKQAFLSRGSGSRHQPANLEFKAEFLTVALGKRNLGLDAAKYARLRDGVDAVVHNAWKVNFNHRLPSFEGVHISGVRHLADLCLSSPRRPHLFFVSSISTVGNWAACHGGASGPVPESIPEEYGEAMELGYAESKHVSERILAAAVKEAGLHGSVLRVGQIAGPVADGVGEWNRTEWFPNLVRSSKTIGLLPDSMNNIDWIPVDTLASIIREIVHAEYERGRSTSKYESEAKAARVFNLVNPQTAEWADLVPALQRHHWVTGGEQELEVVPYEQWLRALRGLEDPDLEEVPALKILDFYVGLAAEAALPREKLLRYETGNCAEASETMARLLPINGEAAEAWLRQWDF